MECCNKSHTGQAYAYYTCNKRLYEKSYSKERAPKDWIERIVVEELTKLVNSDEFINEVADKVVEYQDREQDRSALNALEVRQKENEKSIANMLAAIESGIITPSTKTRLMELEAERANIDKGIARELISEPCLEKDQIVFFLEKFRAGDIEDEAYRIMLVDTFLNSVFLYDDGKLVLVLNYSGEHSKITLSIMEKAVNSGAAEGSCFAPSTAE